MTVSNPPGDSSIFDDGKLKPGTYKIQNLYSQTYLDIHEHSRETCCRPVGDLENGRGLVRLSRGLFSGYCLIITSGKSGLLEQDTLYGW